MQAKEGDNFPDFKLKSDGGVEVSLSDLKGKTSVIYFYPKDDTPGCTKEACGFRDNMGSFSSLGIPVFGVSVDNIESHKKFKQKYSIPFTLLSDSDKTLVSELGIKSLLGTASRVTFILNKDGKILKIYPKVSPDKHAEDILGFLRQQQQPGK
jgi:peroxiredoxin Q/BCP